MTPEEAMVESVETRATELAKFAFLVSDRADLSDLEERDLVILRMGVRCGAIAMIEELQARGDL